MYKQRVVFRTFCRAPGKGFGSAFGSAGAAALLFWAAPGRAGVDHVGPYVQDLGPTTAIVRFEIMAPMAARLEVRPVKGGPSKKLTSDSRGLHDFRVTNLEPRTAYTYRVSAGDLDEEGSFTTAPAIGASAEPFTFLIYGDNRSDEAAHGAMVRAMSQVSSDFLVHTGDFVEDGKDDAQWRRFFAIESSLLRGRCAFATIGNHELLEANGSRFLRYFGRTTDSARVRDAGPIDRRRLGGSVRWGNARFLFLNGMDSFLTGAERAWLDEELTRGGTEEGVVWHIVVVHHGPWSSGPHGNNSRLWDARLPDAFKQHKVDLVLSGHDHIYERGEVEGIKYVVSGGGGAPLYPIQKQLLTTRKAEAAHHFVEANVVGTTMRLVVHRDDGSVLERCGFEKSGAWDCDVKPAPSAIVAAKVPSNEEATKPSVSSSRCACTAVGQPKTSSPTFAAVLACLAALYRRLGRGRPATPNEERSSHEA